MARYVFITGGVVSSLGKGLATAGIGTLLQARGYKVRLRKLDPYLNVDPGTMSPYEHGEVYVTDDAAETDLDLGHYERFTGVPARQSDSISAGRIYQNVLEKERKGAFLGKTIQVIPHVTDEIKEFLRFGEESVDFMLCEIGGTVGDIEGLPFFEAIRQFRQERPAGEVVFVHATLLPYIATSGELKTKPVQHSVKELRSIGIQPDILLCRMTFNELPDIQREKIALFCNVNPNSVISAPDLKSIYEVPLAYHEQGLDRQILKVFGLSDSPEPRLENWRSIVDAVFRPELDVRIGVIGKYTRLEDAYMSLNEALVHGGIANRVRVETRWIDAESLEEDGRIDLALQGMNGILVPGGFGKRGTSGKIAATRFAREKHIPFFGICLGMQIATIEAARNLAGIENAGSEEFEPSEGQDGTAGEMERVVYHMKEWSKGNQTFQRTAQDDKGGTMRLGAYDAIISQGSLAGRIYGTERISERHRHRYEIDIAYRDTLERQGLKFSGVSPDGKLPEICEFAGHPWFVGVQFHPELKSRPFEPHPLFSSFIKAAVKHNRLV